MLTYDLDLQSSRPTYQKVRSKVKRFYRESANKQTHKWMDGPTDGHYQVYYVPDLLFKALRSIKKW